MLASSYLVTMFNSPVLPSKIASTPTGNADVDFLATMIPHHAGAVEMARLVLYHCTYPLNRRLAEEIIAGQQAEIAARVAALTQIVPATGPRG